MKSLMFVNYYIRAVGPSPMAFFILVPVVNINFYINKEFTGGTNVK